MNDAPKDDKVKEDKVEQPGECWPHHDPDATECCGCLESDRCATENAQQQATP